MLDGSLFSCILIVTSCLAYLYTHSRVIQNIYFIIKNKNCKFRGEKQTWTGIKPIFTFLLFPYKKTPTFWIMRNNFWHKNIFQFLKTDFVWKRDFPTEHHAGSVHSHLLKLYTSPGMQWNQGLPSEISISETFTASSAVTARGNSKWGSYEFCRVFCIRA